MKTEYDVGQTVWSKELRKRVTINEISIDADGITYIDPVGICHEPTELSAEEPSITHEQFMNVVNATACKGSCWIEDVWTVVQECFKVAQK